MPWASAGFFSVSGMDGDGVLTLVAGVVILLMGLGSGQGMSRGSRVLGWVAVIAAGAIALYDLSNISELVDTGGEGLFAVRYGPGLFVIIAGAITAAVGLSKTPSREDVDQPTE